MMLHAWTNYRNLTWGYNELRPLAKQPHSQSIFGGSSQKDMMMATIVDSADTLWLMGEKEEYGIARDHIRDFFNISRIDSTLSVFEVTIRWESENSHAPQNSFFRHLGAFLSLYALTKEDFYKEKAQSVADTLLPAFNTKTGIAKSLINTKTGYISNYGWVSAGASILSEFGSLHLEFTYLSKITNKPIYAEKVNRMREVMDKMEKPDGLYSNYVDPETGNSLASIIAWGHWEIASMNVSRSINGFSYNLHDI